MAFQGSLKELPLPDIIQLVSVSGKTGKFTLTRDTDRGFIFLKNGQMVHASVGDLIGEEAIYALAIWNSGEFQFNPGDEPERQTITKSNTNLLMEAARRLDEWRVLSKKIPSVDHVPELLGAREPSRAGHAQPARVAADHEDRRTTARSPRSASALNMSSFDVAKILYGMITGELVLLKKKVDHRRRERRARRSGRPHPRHRRRVHRTHRDTRRSRSIFSTRSIGIMSGDGRRAVDTMVQEFEKTASLMRGLAGDRAVALAHHGTARDGVLIEDSPFGRIVIPERLPAGKALFYTTIDFDGRQSSGRHRPASSRNDSGTARRFSTPQSISTGG